MPTGLSAAALVLAGLRVQEKTQSQAWRPAPWWGGDPGEQSKAAHFLLRDSFFKEPSVQTGSQDATGRLGVCFYHFPGFSRLQLSKVEEGGSKSRAAGRDRPKLQNAQPGRAQGRSAVNGATTDVAPKRGKKGSGPKWGTGDRQDGGAEAAA